MIFLPKRRRSFETANHQHHRISYIQNVFRVHADTDLKIKSEDSLNGYKYCKYSVTSTDTVPTEKQVCVLSVVCDEDRTIDADYK